MELQTILRTTFVPIFILLSLCKLQVTATSCYVCNTGTSPECADASRISAFSQDCTVLGQDRCLKTVGPGTRVVRQCAGIGARGVEGCLDNGDQKTCMCYSNYCNSSPRVGEGPLATVIMTLTTLAIAASIFRTGFF